MSLKSVARLAADEDFRRRVGAAMFTAATQVGSEAVVEDSYDEFHERRRQLVTQMSGFVEEYTELFAWLVASNQAVTHESSDNDIQFTVNSVWSAAAGAGATP
jgi:hypothetical protein